MTKQVVSLLILIVSLSLLSAENFIIGSGSDAQSTVPVDGHYNYGWSKFFYTSSQLQTAGILNPVEITKIAFQIGGSSSLVNYLMDNQSIYIGPFPGTNYGNDYLGHPGYENKTLIYNGSISFNGPGWFFITLSTPYTINPNSGVEILWENRDGSKIPIPPIPPQFCFTNYSPYNKEVHLASDPSFPAGNGTSTSKCPNICFSTGGLEAPQVEISQSGNSFILSWTLIPTASSYSIYVSDLPSGPWNFLTSITGNQYQLTATDPKKFYYIKAISR